MPRIALSLLLCLSSCATTSGLIGQRGRVTDMGQICETMACGGTAEPLGVGIGVAILVGIVLVSAWKR